MAKHPEGYCPVFGNYPAEYNRAVHGPYYPWVNYGRKDTPLSEVKLGELKGWVMRQEKTPAALLAYFSRKMHNYHRCWVQTRYGSPSKAFLQSIVMVSVGSLLTTYSYYKNEREHKYHW